MKYKQFYITEDIYKNSKNHLDDIRIVDKNGKEVPFVIENEESQRKQSENVVAQAKISERIVKSDRIEFVVKFNSQNPNEDLIGNILEIISKENFYTKYELFGSYNGKNWDKIVAGEIYKTPDKQNYRHNDLF